MQRFYAIPCIHIAKSYLPLGLGMLCLIFGQASVSTDLAPTATLIAVNGDISISIQGGSPIPGAVGVILHEGDSIRTRAGASATVELSDRSTLELTENTAVTISVLIEDPQTGASRSNLELWWGSIRSVLPSSGSQTRQSSSITVQTSNASANMAAPIEQVITADSQVSYDPGGNTTTAIANKFDVVMTNLLTEESLLIPQGTVGLVEGSTIQQITMTINFPPGDDRLEEIIRTQGEGEETIKAQLDRIANILKQIPNKMIVIEGHTDNIGDAQANIQLGQRRANSVKNYFVEQHALPPNLLETVSFGIDRPIADNSTDAGRAKNRRVEVH